MILLIIKNTFQCKYHFPIELNITEDYTSGATWSWVCSEGVYAMRSNEITEIMNWRDKSCPPAMIASAGDASVGVHGLAARPAPQLRRLVIVEKRPLLRECLEQCLLGHSPGELVSCASVDQLISRLEGAWSAEPAGDLLVVYSVGSQFIDAATSLKISRILKYGRGIRLVVLSERDEASQATAALEQGASGFIPMTMSLNVVSEAIRLVQAGGLYVPASSLLAANRPHESKGAEGASGLSGLTTRQLAVLEAVRRGKANKIIAYELNMCESTVKVHLRNIMKKLRARNRTEAAFMIHEAMGQRA
jgi:DNA-binding NarL/FixJ family response regulator